MINVGKLKGKIVENGLNVDILSARIGINPSTFYRKIATNGTTFTIEEVSNIIRELNLNRDEAQAIFLP